MEALAERDGDVLRRVVVVDMNVAIAPHAHLHASRTRELEQHLVELQLPVRGVAHRVEAEGRGGVRRVDR